MKSCFKFASILLFASVVIFTIGCTKKTDIKQYGQINGKVKNAVTGEPVSGAGVSLSPSNSSTTTGSDGAFSFVELEPTQYSIQVMKDGFQTNTRTVSVVAGEKTEGDILITPAQPVLKVSTTLLDFGTDKLLLPFEIRNNGAGQLTWNVAGDKPWISANPTTGTTTADVSTVNISIDRSQLGKTTYTGTVVVSSNGGSATINVTVNVTGPILNVSTTLLDYGTDKVILPFEIRNDGANQLTWNIAVDKPWISANPTTGNTTTGVSTVSISIDRTQLGKTIYTGTVVISSNGGSATINVTVNVTGPLLNVTPTELDFGTAESEKTLQISNLGVGSLSYNAISSQTWLTLQNPSGTTTNEIKLIQVFVNRAGLTPGNYSGTVVINSNANNVTVPVMIQVLTPATPVVVNGTVSNLTNISAQISGSITSLGSNTVTQHGHCWSTSPTPTTDNNKTTLGTALVIGDYTSDLSDLSSATSYYVRAYATNSVGTAYSGQVQFTTDAGPKPTVTTANLSNITSTTATGGGNVTAQGGTPVTARGVCWSTNPNPTITNSYTNNGSGMGSFISDITDLSPATTYYVRAYATNTAGTNYGTQMQFATTAGQPPTLTTANITNITATTATGGGNVTDQGGTPVSVRGVCWSTIPNPTITNSHTTDGSGTGNFISDLTNMLPVTTYYVRAYATNSAGTAYGNQVQFTTEAGQPPTVTTANITNITATTATGGGNVTDQGSTSVTARGVCWSTNTNPTIADSYSNNGSGTGNFTSDLTSLDPVTIYYVRAYATSSIGTSYGNEVSFTTEVAPPVVTNGLVAYYTFDNQTAQDWTGNFNGIPYNMMYSTSTPNGFGYSAQFNGANSYISILHAFFSGTMDFTFSVWIKSSTNNFMFYSQFGGVYSYNYVGTDNNNKVKYAMNHLSPYTFSNSASGLFDNSWHHFVYLRQGNTIKYFIDNVLMDSRTENGAMHENIKTNIGNSGYSNNNFFNGSFDNVRFFNRALNNQEIQQIYSVQQ